MTHIAPSSTFELATTDTKPNSDTVERIRNFSALENGWNFGRGIPPSETTIALAIRLLRFAGALGFTSSDAVPGTGGEINIILYRFEHRIEMLIEANNTITLYREKDNKEIAKKEKLSENECRKLLVSISGEILGWLGSVYLTHYTLKELGDTIGSHSVMTAMAPDRAFFVRVAQLQIAEACARMLGNFTPAEAESHLLSGSFPEMFFLDAGTWSKRAMKVSAPIDAIMKSKMRQMTS